MKKFVAVASALVLGGSLGGLALFAQAAPRDLAPGDLDPTFGQTGRVVTKVDSQSSARALAIQRNGKIVAAGGAGLRRPGFAVVRYERDGSLDPTFGSNGRVTTRLGEAPGLSSGPATSLALQHDGKIVAAGHGYGYFALVRYKRNGKLDAGFGTRGIVRTSFSRRSGGAADAEEVALQPDGRIVAVGSALYLQGGGALLKKFALVRYDVDGSLDSSFGSGGKVTTATNGIARDVAIQPDGKIVVAGSSESGSHALFTVARYERNGALDPSFGSGGIVRTAVGSLDGASAVVLQRNGKIVVVGDAGTRRSVFALARYNADGTLDSRFGRGGKVRVGFGRGSSASPTAAAQQRKGRIVVAGWVSRYPNWEFALARFRANGSLDRTFGAGGVTMTSFRNAGPNASRLRQDTAWAFAIQADGKIIAAGDGAVDPITSREPQKTKFELARYIGRR